MGASKFKLLAFALFLLTCRNAYMNDLVPIVVGSKGLIDYDTALLTLNSSELKTWFITETTAYAAEEIEFAGSHVLAVVSKYGTGALRSGIRIYVLQGDRWNKALETSTYNETIHIVKTNSAMEFWGKKSEIRYLSIDIQALLGTEKSPANSE